MIFKPGDFIKHRFSVQILQEMGLHWLAQNPQPIKVVQTEERNSRDCSWEVLYHFENPGPNGDIWSIWGDEDQFYQDNECRTLE